MRYLDSNFPGLLLASHAEVLRLVTHSSPLERLRRRLGLLPDFREIFYDLPYNLYMTHTFYCVMDYLSDL